MITKYENGLVSVIIPTYKRSEKLTRAIHSVLAQTYENLEVLVVNDNEPEDEYTAQLKAQVKQYDHDTRFRLVMQKKHINGAVARNVGIRQAKGEYIAFLDDDDWWESNKLELQVKELSGLSEEWGVVSCRIKRYNNDVPISVLPRYKDGYVYKDVLMLTSDFATGTLLFRHDLLDTTRCFDENLLRHQDLQLLVDFTCKFKLKQLDEVLHCADVSDAQNRPDPEKLMYHKKRFFESIRPIMNSLTKSEQKCIYCMHQYELGYQFLKRRNVKEGVKYSAYVFTSGKAFRLAAKKTFKKVWSKFAK